MAVFGMEEIAFIFKFIFKDVLFGVLLGFRDSLYGIYGLHVHYKKKNSLEAKQSRDLSSIKYKGKSEASRDFSLKKEKEFNVRKEVYRCSIYNGAAYAASFIVFKIILFNLKLMLEYTLTEGSALSVYEYTDWIFTTIFDMIWIAPLFVIMKVMNTFWFQDIASYAYRHHYGRPQTFSFANLISDNVFSAIIETLFLLQASLMKFVPYPLLGTILMCLHLSLLNSLYSFEYLWLSKGWTFHKRISYIEVNWPYFLGFGIPLTLSTVFLSSVLQSGFIYSFCFPMFIISAIEAPPLRQENQGPHMKIFSIVVWLPSVVMKWFFKDRWSTTSR